MSFWRPAFDPRLMQIFWDLNCLSFLNANTLLIKKGLFSLWKNQQLFLHSNAPDPSKVLLWLHETFPNTCCWQHDCLYSKKGRLNGVCPPGVWRYGQKRQTMGKNYKKIAENWQRVSIFDLLKISSLKKNSYQRPCVHMLYYTLQCIAQYSAFNLITIVIMCNHSQLFVYIVVYDFACFYKVYLRIIFSYTS